MRWTDKHIEILKCKLEEGLSYQEIGGLLGIEKNPVRLKAQKLNLKSKSREKNSLLHITKKCNNCNEEFTSLICESRKFCSRSCSASYNNKNRIYTDTQKTKAREVLDRIRPKSKKLYCKNKNIKFCKKCKCDFFCRTNKLYCEDCRNSYYHIYRPACEFTFNLNEVKEKLENFHLLEEFGKYSPSNKGNNVNGVSRDHMVSVKWGFDNNIPPSIIKHPANCKLMLHSENNKKKTKNSISYEELLVRIEHW